VRAPGEEKIDDSEGSFYEELEQVSKHFLSTVILGICNAKVGRGNIFKPTIGNGEICYMKNLIFKGNMFPHRNFHKYTWTSPDRQTHNHIDHILRDRRWYSSILDVRSFRRAGCDTDHYLVDASVRERLTLSNQAAQKFGGERFNIWKLNELEVSKQHQIKFLNRFAALENLSNGEDINRDLENIKENVKTATKKG
jgi:hypothetical protein